MALAWPGAGTGATAPLQAPCEGRPYHEFVVETSDIIEVEWQFGAADIGRVTAWLDSARVPGYTVTGAGAKDVRDTYYDTADWRFTRGRFTLRVRNKKDGAEATLKAAASYNAGIRSRRELTEPLTGNDGVALAAAPGAVGGSVRLVAGPKALAPLFDLQQHRVLYRLADADGDLGEISADETDILAPGREAARIVRVEVEVEDGFVERAQRFVEVLVVAAGLVEEPTSKFQSAIQAGGLEPVGPEVGLGSTTVASELSIAEVAYAILRKQFAVFIANEPGTRIGEDIEALHDMRVAARRMRAALSAFRLYLPPAWIRLREQLGWVAAALGEVRDLDVQIERMAEWRAESGEASAAALNRVEAVLQQRRAVARRKMLFALNSRRYEGMTLRMSATLRRGPGNRPLEGKLLVTEVAPLIVRKRQRRLSKMGGAINAQSPAEAYHLLRIDGKKLRYACEFFGPIYGEPALAFARRVTALQDVLGLHQDAEVAITMLEEMARTHGRRLGPETVLVMGSISERYRRHAGELRGQFPAVFKALEKEWPTLRKALTPANKTKR